MPTHPSLIEGDIAAAAAQSDSTPKQSYYNVGSQVQTAYFYCVLPGLCSSSDSGYLDPRQKQPDSRTRGTGPLTLTKNKDNGATTNDTERKHRLGDVRLSSESHLVQAGTVKRSHAAL